MKRKWNYKQHQDDDRFEKFGRMGSKSRRARTSKDQLSDDFILPAKEWPKLENGFAARIVEVHKRACFINPEPEFGDIHTHDVWMAKIAGKFYTATRDERNFFCVGDRVYCRQAEAREQTQNSDLPQCVIMHLEPRRNKIARTDPMYAQREHVLAANVDLLVIVASFLSPRVKFGLIDRYLVLAELQGLEPLIVLNKLDLLEADRTEHPEFYALCMERAATYEQLGYRVFKLQANGKRTLKTASTAALVNALKDRISMFSGHSGVGKSTIVNLMKPEIEQDVEPDSNIFYKGRHTTSYASFIKLGQGGYVIDTPGIRSFVIGDMSAIELSHGYRDIRPFAAHCKFRECRHIEEPECAVLPAVAAGQIATWRYDNYKGILLGTTGREGRQREYGESEADFINLEEE